jgi:hypothetical protein
MYIERTRFVTPAESEWQDRGARRRLLLQTLRFGGIDLKSDKTEIVPERAPLIFDAAAGSHVDEDEWLT